MTDAQGGAMPGATIVARHSATAFQITRTSGRDGRFLLPGLPVGEYTLSVEMPGFKRAVRTGVVLLLGQQARLDFALELGGLREEVTVPSETSMLQTANAEVANSFSSRCSATTSGTLFNVSS